MPKHKWMYMGKEIELKFLSQDITMNKKEMRKIFLRIINNQIRDNNLPETKQTLDRLISEGFSEEKAKEMIGCIVISEIYDVLKSKKEFNEQRYIAALNKLPEQC